ncbi:MAG: response regulator transcription factor [Bacteroidetes bacterium]|nr:response regulator transcription factor [Bacteroidota bacterium]
MTVKQIHIMLVDDHQLIIDGISARLADTPHLKIIAQADNGRDALEKLKKCKPDVILMDVEMPVMNGFETTQQIRLKYPDIKVIALSTYDEKSIILKMLNAGACGFLLKNIKKEELLQAIETVMSGKQYFSSEISLALAKPSMEDPPVPQSPYASGAAPLSDRELEVLRLVVQGLSNTQIAARLFISAKTVNTHRTHVMHKLEVHNVASLIRVAIQHKLV